MSIVELKSQTPNETLISYLEKLLKEARAGELQSALFVTVHSDGGTGNGWPGLKYNHMAVIGELEVLKRDVMDSAIDLWADS